METSKSITTASIDFVIDDGEDEFEVHTRTVPPFPPIRFRPARRGDKPATA